MKKIKKHSKYYELTENVNCIPAGTYRLVTKDEGMYQFSVSKNIIFGIFGNVSGILKPVSKRRYFRQKTSEPDFIDKYYRLLPRLPKSGGFDPDKPYTMCAIDPSVALELN